LNIHTSVVETCSANSVIAHQNVCTVEELERDLISQRNAVPLAPPAGVGKPSPALRLEDVERDLTTSNPGVGTTSSFPGVTLGLGRGQPQPSPFPHQVSRPDVGDLKIGIVLVQ
jgi:hypothetical protein